MRNSFLVSIIVLLTFSLSAQTTIENEYHNTTETSYEISLGVSNVGLNCKRDCDLLRCGNDYYEFVNDEGFELSTRFGFNKSINERDEFLFGAGLNFWIFEVDIYNFGDTGTESKLMGILDLFVGYRLLFANIGSSSLYVENTFHSEWSANIEFGNFKFSVEPGIGLKSNINESTSLITTLNYKRAIIGHSGAGYYEKTPSSLGGRIGINKKL